MSIKNVALAGFDEPLRQLYLIAVDPDLRLPDKVHRLLEVGADALGVELGIVSSIDKGVYECRFVHGPDWGPEQGAIFDVNGTYCLHTLKNDGVTAFFHACEEEISDHPCYKNFGLESYIGAPVLQGEKRYGTLNFSSPNARPQPFSEKEKEFVEFLARWLGNELKLAAERKELREQKTLLSSVIDAVPEAVVMADAERRIVVVNPAVERLFGHRPDQLLNCQTAVLYNALSDYEMNAGNRINPETLSDHDKIPIVCRRRDGTTFDGEVSSVVVRTERGEHIGYLSVIRDVTEANRFERAKDELIATVSHELKTPMTSLYGSLRLLAGSASEIPPSSKKLLDVALRNAESVNHMIGDILDLEKLMAVDNQADFEPSDLGKLLEQAAESVRPYAEERNVSVVFARSRALTPNLMMHKQRVVRLALNLLSNGIKASPEGGVVNLGLTENGTGFFVRDAGGGIPVDLQPVLFDRFTRAQSYRVNEGSGLGMSIVKAIVDQHLGSIGFETHEGQGTTFLVHFPPAMDVPAEEREV